MILIFSFIILSNIFPSFATFKQDEKLDRKTYNISIKEINQTHEMAREIAQILTLIPDFSNPGKHLDATQASKPPYSRVIERSPDNFYDIDQESALYQEHKKEFNLHFPLILTFQNYQRKPH